MGFSIVSRANNHALDWGIEGLHETSRWLDEAGIVHAGAGETRGLARAPQYFESTVRPRRADLAGLHLPPHHRSACQNTAQRRDVLASAGCI